jgi:hypothetical protein
MMHPGLLGLLAGAVARIGAECRSVRDRVTPGVEQLHDVAIGNAHDIVARDADRRKTDTRPARRPSQRRETEEGQCGTTQTGLQASAGA